MKDYNIYIGFDPKEALSYSICKYSVTRRLTIPVPVHGVSLRALRAQGLYTRQIEILESGSLYDLVSQAPMSTEFAISRFLVPHLAQSGLAVFMDSDMLCRTNLVELLRMLEQEGENKAVWVVKHDHVPQEHKKKSGHVQTQYPRKNWSSFMVFDCDHPANQKLTPELVNVVTGRNLHGFCWLEDDQIGELPPQWNYLVGVSDKVEDPAIVHYTLGGPWLPEYRDAPYSDEWFAEMDSWLQ